MPRIPLRGTDVNQEATPVALWKINPTGLVNCNSRTKASTHPKTRCWKKAETRLLTRAAQTRDRVFAGVYEPRP
jgi:hypothetical protein